MNANCFHPGPCPLPLSKQGDCEGCGFHRPPAAPSPICTRPHIELPDKYSHCGEAPCGCLLTHDDEGAPEIFLCHTHAAAPDMFKALEAVLEWAILMQQGKTYVANMRKPVAFEMLRAAMEKAKPGTHAAQAIIDRTMAQI